jgi:dipeptidyl-peptidase-4
MLSRRTFRLAPAVVLAALVLGVAGADAADYEPLSHYKTKDIEGWHVYVHRDLLPGGAHREIGKGAIDQLQYGLAKMEQIIPKAPLEKLKDVKIWLEVNSTNGPHGRTPAYQYHPGLDWLKKMDFHPKKHKCVEYGKAKSLANRSDFSAAHVTLHELAHAYHDQVLGFDHEPILAAHERAQEEGRYPEGDWVVDADHKEFFAGLTTRYFKSEESRRKLVERDPIFAERLKEYWGDPKALLRDPLHPEKTADASSGSADSAQKER